MNEAFVFSGTAMLFLLYCTAMLCYSWLVVQRVPSRVVRVHASAGTLHVVGGSNKQARV